MSKKTSLSYAERQRIEFLTSHLRSLSRPSTKARYEDELAQILEGKELTRGDLALAAYYLGNTSQSAEDTAAAQDFAAAYRSTAAE
ncbi:hypothetical protein [Pseudomonas syringae]|uniref:DNA-binding transcriptional regulator n=1 Tax=Pseudomonas syringae pv. actinidiae TaxID=103796 RepID=A0A2V0QNL3_PSESF|nr:hypothetical protein [Pseudomonas syringae]EPN17535.1 hypothetical protein A259_12571 [Pseudomonas syringae pv. actinidiae ICMP 19070]AQL38746.1 hypothetical protein JN853_21540 [Pseudomonas syringae pv. actinidiae ICMP 9853]EPM95204.1 hypothetical protein A258_17825 [Pseudomonas syringae pv. actinidiae ICMP 19104]MDG6386780.1 hypothetical protein [Pseudomonas syringae]NVL23819.1 hypothetical protein [Pseudomonas syringae pv. actinidiae]